MTRTEMQCVPSLRLGLHRRCQEFRRHALPGTVSWRPAKTVIITLSLCEEFYNPYLDSSSLSLTTILPTALLSAR